MVHMVIHIVNHMIHMVIHIVIHMVHMVLHIAHLGHLSISLKQLNTL